MNAITERRPLAVYYEHPEWFQPLFRELDRRDVPHVRLHAAEHAFDPGAEPPPYALLLNRMSPSAWLRGAGDAIGYTTQYLAWLERRGVRVVNGTAAYRIEISKAEQIALLAQLGLPHPRTRVIHRAQQASCAAEGLRFPVIVKPNIGGSGAGCRRFEDPAQLRGAVARDELDLGLDHTALVQELVPAESGRIVRVEVLGGRFLYAIRIYTSFESFDLCPADVCQAADGAELSTAAACPADSPKRGLRVEGYTPPPEIVAQAERIAAAAGLDVGGIEYLLDERDGTPRFYDINALSNFVADAPRVIGFDPFERLVDYLIEEAV